MKYDHGLDMAFPGRNPWDNPEMGLTKREYIAIRLTAALITAGGYTRSEAVRRAVDTTEELLAALERKPE
jgi:hypothetical protein